MGRDGSVGIATRYGLDQCFPIFFVRRPLLVFGCVGSTLWAGLFGDRNQVGARFSATVQTGPGAQLASCTMGIDSSSQE
jgi:hypothetical protein